MACRRSKGESCHVVRSYHQSLGPLPLNGERAGIGLPPKCTEGDGRPTPRKEGSKGRKPPQVFFPFAAAPCTRCKRLAAHISDVQTPHNACVSPEALPAWLTTQNKPRPAPHVDLNLLCSQFAGSGPA